MPKLKCFTGNLDGQHRGMVITTSKKKVAEVTGSTLHDINADWDEESMCDVHALFDSDVLYTQPSNMPMGSEGLWVLGRCELKTRS